MNSKSSELLEYYIKGKDKDEYKILEKIYDDNAEVAFEIASNQISFPETIHGNIEIARVLSKDFNQIYSKIKTYYLSLPSRNTGDIENQKWLVVMRDINSAKTRVGTGYYNWEFVLRENTLRIKKHKIYIHSMIEIEDIEMSELIRIQSSLNYPWTTKSHVLDVIQINPSLNAVESYLNK